MHRQTSQSGQNLAGEGYSDGHQTNSKDLTSRSENVAFKSKHQRENIT